MLFLTSSVTCVAKKLISHLSKPPAEIRLTFIPTASEVKKGDLLWLKKERQSLVDAGFQVTDFTVTGKTKAEVTAMLDNTDIVFVSGGNSFYLLQEMRKSGFANVIHQYVDNGLIYGGSSAGSIVAGPDLTLLAALDATVEAPELTDFKGLGLVDVVVFPHWGSDHFREKYTQRMMDAYKRGQKIILLTDDQYLLVDNGTYSIQSI